MSRFGAVIRILNYIGIGIVIVCAAFMLLSRIYWPATHNTFGHDQARDAAVVQQMRQGKLPQYGPSSSKGEYSLFPHFYYILFVFGFWTNDPTPLVYFNSISSLITFILLFKICFDLSTRSKLKWFWVGIIMLLYSSSVWLLREANMIWNPNSLPMFVLGLILLLNKTQNYLLSNSKLNLKALGYLISISVVSVVAMSLHSSAMFMLPPWLFWWIVNLKKSDTSKSNLADLPQNSSLDSTLFYTKPLDSNLFKNLNITYKLQIVLTLLVSGLITNIPYFLSEIQNNWKNTRGILSFLKHSSSNVIDFSLLDTLTFKLHNAIFNWLDIWSMFYTPNTYGTLVIILGVASFIGIFWHKYHLSGKHVDLEYSSSKQILYLVLALSIIYMLVSANLTGISLHHYKVVGVVLPLIGLLNFLQNLELKKIAQLILAFLIVSISFLGIVNNLEDVVVFAEQKYGREFRMLNTLDYENIAKLAKENNIKQICINTFQDNFHLYGIEYFARYHYQFQPIYNTQCQTDFETGKSLTLVDKGMGKREEVKFVSDKKVYFENSAVKVYVF